MANPVTFQPLSLHTGLLPDAPDTLAQENLQPPEAHTLRTERPINESDVPPATPASAYAGPIDIVQQGDTYHVSVDLDMIDPGCGITRSFLMWLLNRSASETIYLSATNAFPPSNFCVWLSYISPLFEALERCQAKTICVVDGPMLSLDAYVAMACKHVELGPYALITVQPAWPGAGGGVSSDELARRSLAQTLWRRAVDLQLLTEDEVAQLEDSRPVTVSTTTFEGAAYEHLSLTAMESR